LTLAAQQLRRTSVNLIPTVGADDIAFGTPEAAIIALLGKPATDQQLKDVDGYPASRRVLNYIQRGFLVTPDHGMVAVIVEAAESPIVLSGKDVSRLSLTDLAAFIEALGYSAAIKKHRRSRDCEVESLDGGIVACFVENKLESTEIHDPSWRTMIRPRAST
jgi:hypothetical protein